MGGSRRGRCCRGRGRGRGGRGGLCVEGAVELCGNLGNLALDVWIVGHCHQFAFLDVEWRKGLRSDAVGEAFHQPELVWQGKLVDSGFDSVEY